MDGWVGGWKRGGREDVPLGSLAHPVELVHDGVGGLQACDVGFFLVCVERWVGG